MNIEPSSMSIDVAYLSNLPFSETKTCRMQGGGRKGLVVQIKRHMRLCHPDIQEEEVTQKSRIYERKEYDLCGVRTTRLDLHLIRVHRMQRGEELLAVLKDSQVIKVHNKETAALDKCINDFK